MREELEKKMVQGMEKLSVVLSDTQMRQFEQYFQLLTEWNKVMNLTAITELDDVVTKHFVDSVSLVKALDRNEICDKKILDLGTGAGFPGIPLKIVFPDIRMCLMDSLNKRIKFLNEVIGVLGLKEIEAVHGRAEDYGRDREYREKFDVCVSRAVANLSTLSEYCIPFVKLGGCFVSYKSGKAEEEIRNAKAAWKLLGGKLEDVVEFSLPGSDMERILVKVRKTEGTNKRYPRKAGLPGKEPLR